MINKTQKFRSFTTDRGRGQHESLDVVVLPTHRQWFSLKLPPIHQWGQPCLLGTTGRLNLSPSDHAHRSRNSCLVCSVLSRNIGPCRGCCDEGPVFMCISHQLPDAEWELEGLSTGISPTHSYEALLLRFCTILTSKAVHRWFCWIYWFGCGRLFCHWIHLFGWPEEA